MKFEIFCLICGKKRGGRMGVDHRKCSIEMKKIADTKPKKTKTTTKRTTEKYLDFRSKTGQW